MHQYDTLLVHFPSPAEPGLCKIEYIMLEIQGATLTSSITRTEEGWRLMSVLKEMQQSSLSIFIHSSRRRGFPTSCKFDPVSHSPRLGVWIDAYTFDICYDATCVIPANALTYLLNKSYLRHQWLNKPLLK